MYISILKPHVNITYTPEVDRSISKIWLALLSRNEYFGPSPEKYFSIRVSIISPLDHFDSRRHQYISRRTSIMTFRIKNLNKEKNMLFMLARISFCSVSFFLNCIKSLIWIILNIELCHFSKNGEINVFNIHDYVSLLCMINLLFTGPKN